MAADLARFETQAVPPQLVAQEVSGGACTGRFVGSPRLVRTACLLWGSLLASLSLQLSLSQPIHTAAPPFLPRSWAWQEPLQLQWACCTAPCGPCPSSRARHC